MNELTITTDIKKEEYVTLKKLYRLFFNETLEEELYGNIAATNLAAKATYELAHSREEDVNFWLVKDQSSDEIVAFAKAKIYNDGVGLFCHVFVRPDYRAKVCNIDGKQNRIFWALSHTVHDWFVSMGMHTIEIETSKSKKPLLHVEKDLLGFEVISELSDTILLRKKLGEPNEWNSSSQ